MKHASRISQLRLGVALLAVAMAPLAHAGTLWELEFVAEVSPPPWESGESFVKTFDFVWNPANLYDPCQPPQPDPLDVACAAGEGITLSWYIRTQIDGIIIHDGMLEPRFWFNPFPYSADRSLDIKGEGWGWPNPTPGHLTISEVPEPGSLALLAIGLAGMGFGRRRNPGA